jgi:hypothetical protein
MIHFKIYRRDEFCHLPNIAVSSPSRRLYGPEVKTHFSNIPTFHRSNWGEAPNYDSGSVGDMPDKTLPLSANLNLHKVVQK